MSIQWSNIVVQIRFPDCQSKDPRSNSRWIHFYQVSIFYQLFSSHYYFNHCYRSIMNPRIVKNNNCDFAFYRLQHIYYKKISNFQSLFLVCTKIRKKSRMEDNQQRECYLFNSGCHHFAYLAFINDAPSIN